MRDRYINRQMRRRYLVIAFGPGEGGGEVLILVEVVRLKWILSFHLMTQDTSAGHTSEKSAEIPSTTSQETPNFMVGYDRVEKKGRGGEGRDGGDDDDPFTRDQRRGTPLYPVKVESLTTIKHNITTRLVESNSIVHGINPKIRRRRW